MTGFINWWIQHRKKQKQSNSNIYRSNLGCKQQLSKNYVNAVKNKGIKSKEAACAYVDIRMNGGFISFDYPPQDIRNITWGWVTIND